MLRRLFGRQETKTPDEVKLEESLQKSRTTFFGRLGSLFQEKEITDELWEKVEDTLIRGDVGMTVTMELVERARARILLRGGGGRPSHRGGSGITAGKPQ